MARRIGPERQRERALQQALQERISGALERGIRKEIQRESERLAKIYSITRDVGELSPEHPKRILALLQQGYTATVQAFGSRVLEATREASKGVTPQSLKDDHEELWVRIVLDFMAERKAQRIAEEIAATTRMHAKRIAEQELEKQEDQSLVPAAIIAGASAVAIWRARTIARTESHAAAGFGAMATANQTGLPMVKEWISARDERVRQGRFDHVAADGEIVPINAAFQDTGEPMMYPGDPNGSVGNVINCRCQAGYLLDED